MEEGRKQSALGRTSTLCWFTPSGGAFSTNIINSIMLSEDESSSELSLSPLPSQEEDGFTFNRIAYVSYSWAYSSSTIK